MANGPLGSGPTCPLDNPALDTRLKYAAAQWRGHGGMWKIAPLPPFAKVALRISLKLMREYSNCSNGEEYLQKLSTASSVYLKHFKNNVKFARVRLKETIIR